MPRNYLANSDLQLQPVPYGEAPLTVCRWPEPDYVLPQKIPKNVTLPDSILKPANAYVPPLLHCRD
jgi:hypothetical protein